MQTGYKIIIVTLLILFGSLLIANGACTIEWTRQGGIIVNGKKEVVTTTGDMVEVATQEEEDTIEKDRKGFLQAMSAINIIAGIFLFILAGYFVIPDTYEVIESKVRKVPVEQNFFKGSRAAAAAAAATQAKADFENAKAAYIAANMPKQLAAFPGDFE